MPYTSGDCDAHIIGALSVVHPLYILAGGAGHKLGKQAEAAHMRLGMVAATILHRRKMTRQQLRKKKR